MTIYRQSVPEGIFGKRVLRRGYAILPDPAQFSVHAVGKCAAVEQPDDQKLPVGAHGLPGQCVKNRDEGGPLVVLWRGADTCRQYQGCDPAGTDGDNRRCEISQAFQPHALLRASPVSSRKPATLNQRFLPCASCDVRQPSRDCRRSPCCTNGAHDRACDRRRAACRPGPRTP